MINKEIKILSKSIYIITSNDVYCEGANHGKSINKNDLYSEEDKCGGLPTTISLCVNARVM